MLKKITLGLILSTQIVSFNLCNVPTEPNKNTKLHAAALGLLSVASAYGALYCHYRNIYEITYGSAILGSATTSIATPKEQRIQYEKNIDKHLHEHAPIAITCPLILGSLSYIFLQKAKSYWKQACKNNAQAQE